MSLPTIPHVKSGQNLEEKRNVRNKLRERQLQTARRDPDSFEVSQEVVIRSEKSGRWNCRCIVEEKRNRGSMVRSYTLRNMATGKLLSRNERHIRLLNKIVTDNAG